MDNFIEEIDEELEGEEKKEQIEEVYPPSPQRRVFESRQPRYDSMSRRKQLQVILIPVYFIVSSIFYNFLIVIF